MTKKRHSKFYRSLLRGSLKLKKQKKPFFVLEIINELSSVNLGLEKKDFPKYLIGQHGGIGERCVRQLLMLQHNSVVTKVMYAIGNNTGAIVPFPKVWRDYLNKKGLKINNFLSRTKFLLFLLKSFIVGVGTTLKLTLQKGFPVYNNSQYIVFDNLSENNVNNNGHAKYTLLNWYKNSILKSKDSEIIWAKVLNISNDFKQIENVHIVNNLLPKIGNCFSTIFFSCSCIFLIIRIFFGVIVGKWWLLILLRDAIYLKYVKALSTHFLAKKYFFHNSHWFYKPLWLEEVEIKGSEAILYFYSTNTEPFSINSNICLPTSYGLFSMTWKNFAVWDKRQCEFYKTFCPNANFIKMGFIDFSDVNIKLDIKNDFTNIAIFDVTPTRLTFHSSLGFAIPPYYSEEVVIQFIIDLQKIFTPEKNRLYWKRKRKVHRFFISSSFSCKIEQIWSPHLIEVNPGIAAHRLIDKCDVVVSLPFTSTSLLGQVSGKKAIYYDPTNSIEFDGQNHGIPVIKGIDELKTWYNQNIGK